MADKLTCELSDYEFYNIHEHIDPDAESCECLPCKRYLLYKNEKEEFKAKIYANIPQPSEKLKQFCSSENCNCLRCQSKIRYQQCREEGANSLCYKIRYNITLDDCDCEALIPDNEVANYMHTASCGKNLPVDYMDSMMNRFEICVPGLTNDKHESSIHVDELSDDSKSKYSKHVPLPLPIFTPKSYDTEENPQNYDVYHMNAKLYGLSARSAFKLLQIDEKYEILKNAKRVVDLCAAPGGWSKVLSTRLFFGSSDISQYSELIQKYKRNKDAFMRSDIKIVAVDLMDMLPIPGVIKVVGDISKIETANAVINEFEGELADVVVCDGAADVSISMPMGEFMHRMVVFAALHITCNVLKQNGTLVMKVFYCGALLNWVKMAEQLFNSVEIYKPDSSRHTSPECFLICQNYNPPDGFEPKLLTQYTNFDSTYDYNHLTGVNKEIIPILVSDDFTYKEKDKSYLSFREVYDTHRKMFEGIDEKPRWKVELEELKKKRNDISEAAFDEKYEAILQGISERANEDKKLAKGVRDKVLCELERRGNKRNLLEVQKCSKSKNKQILRRNAWAKEDALLCPETVIILPENDEDACEQQQLSNIISIINRDKAIRNAECDHLRASGADEETIIQKRIELYTEHQKSRFREADIKSWVNLRKAKRSTKKVNKKSEEELSGKMDEMKF